MRPRTTILLGLVFIGLVVAYMLTNVRAHRAARESWEAKRLFQFDPADVEKLSIQQQDADVIEAERAEDGAWRFTGAHSAIAPNGPLLDQFAAAVTAATNERPIAGQGADLAAFGLDVPKLVIRVTPRGSEPQRIAFGGLDPTQRHRYAQLGDNTIFLARAELFSALDRPFLDLRDRRIFTNLADGLTRVDYERLPVETDDETPLDADIKRHTTAIHETYEKNSAGEWRMTRPLDAHAWQARLELLERALQNITGREYIDDPESLGDYGLATPFSTLTAYGKDGTNQTLLFGWLEENAENAGMYVKRTDQDSIAVIDGSMLVVLPREPEAFREKRLFTGDAKFVNRIRYRDASAEFELENDAEKGWRLVGPGADETDQAEVSLYIATLKTIEGDSFLAEGTPADFDPARISLELLFGDGRPPANIVVGGPVPAAASDPIEMYARQDFGAVTTISIKDFLALKADSFRFRVKTLFAFDRSLASEAEMTIDGKHVRFAQANGRWSVVEPADHRLELQTDLTDFLDALAKAEVRGAAGPAPSAEIQGTDAPILEVRINVAGPNARTLGPIRVGNLTAPSSRDRFVTISGRDGVYIVDQELIDAARRCQNAIRPR